MKASKHKQIILDKIYEERVPSEEELIDIFPKLFTTQSLVQIDKSAQNGVKREASRNDASTAFVTRPEDVSTRVGTAATSRRRTADAVPNLPFVYDAQPFKEYTLRSFPKDIKPKRIAASANKKIYLMGSSKDHVQQIKKHFASPLSAAVIEIAFWYVHSSRFSVNFSETEKNNTLRSLAHSFVNFLTSINALRSETFKFYHYFVAQCIFDAFSQHYPEDEEMNGPMKLTVLRDIIELFIGDFFEFSFHIEMFRQLFGDSEIRDLIRDKKIQSNASPLFFQPPDTRLINSDIRRVERLAAEHNDSPRHSISYQEEDDINENRAEAVKSLLTLDTLASDTLRIPVYWSKFTLFSGYPKLSFKNFSTYLNSPIVQEYLGHKNGLPSTHFLRWSTHERSIEKPYCAGSVLDGQGIFKSQEKILEHYAERQRELEEDRKKISKRLVHANTQIHIEERLVLNSKPEDIHRFCGELMNGRADKEKKFKTIQANLDEYDQTLDRAQLLNPDYGISLLARPHAGLITLAQPAQAVLAPIDWSLMESLRKIKESKTPLPQALSGNKIRSARPMTRGD
ncbi:hypothetical protein PROFUN_13830 [Planoprotostelium fungivorum]|uniref:Uncharacterized protein n=1 Tax=Planoprotostelium fungivorum TaxID=1890364 RepID=A0A2P6N2V7_9EUKA|nr:hypothetical protein PROFUN_13830 [Planoprotostelium fungivorum]